MLFLLPAAPYLIAAGGVVISAITAAMTAGKVAKEVAEETAKETAKRIVKTGLRQHGEAVCALTVEEVEKRNKALSAEIQTAFQTRDARHAADIKAFDAKLEAVARQGQQTLREAIASLAQGLAAQQAPPAPPPAPSAAPAKPPVPQAAAAAPVAKPATKTPIVVLADSDENEPAQLVHEEGNNILVAR